VIKGFADKESERLFARQFSKRLPHDFQRSARRKLEVLNVAKSLDDLRVPPGNHLEKLVGVRKGQHSIRINQRWRICFVWKAGDAYDVAVVDYHRE
jgi:proteic killer suppression protein